LKALKKARAARAAARRSSDSRTRRETTRRSGKARTASRGKSKSPVTRVTRARAASPARNTHGAMVLVRPVKRRKPLPSPLPTRHVAPPRPALVVPARSMPPMTRKPSVPAAAPARQPVAIPDFNEAGVLLAITYSIREGRRGEFFDLMRELKPLLVGIGGLEVAIYEDRSRPNYLMEVFRFKDEAEFTAFDDKFHKDRKIAAIYALLDDIVEAEKSDFKIFERRL
jgi:hypothetical protein